MSYNRDEFWNYNNSAAQRNELRIKCYTILRHLNGNGIIVKLNPFGGSKKNMYKIYNVNNTEIYSEKDFIEVYKMRKEIKEDFSVALNKIMVMFLGSKNE